MQQDTRIILISSLSIVLVTGVILFIKYRQNLLGVATTVQGGHGLTIQEIESQKVNAIANTKVQSLRRVPVTMSASV